MSSREIGRITSVGINGVVVDVNSDLGNYINTIDGILFIGEVGSYVSIYEIGRTIIAEIIGVDEKVQSANVNELARPDSTRKILLTIGKSVVFPDYEVKVNIDKFFGFHFAVFGNTGSGKSNTIAKILQNIFEKQNYSAKGAKFVIIDSNGEYNKAFSKLNELNSNIKHSLMSTDEVGEKKFEIPVWALSADDWATLLHASEKTQIPVLKRAIDIARIFYNCEVDDVNIKNHILASTLLGIIQSSDTSPSKSDKLKAIVTKFKTNDISMSSIIKDDKTLGDLIGINYGSMIDEAGVISFLMTFLNAQEISDNILKAMVPYSLSDFIKAVEFATLYEGSISSQRIQEYTSTLMTRLQSLQDGVQGRIFSKTEFNTVEEYIKSLLGENQIVDLDISSLDDSSAEVVTKVLAKLILDYLKGGEVKAETPINFIIEEAHRFIKNDTNYGVIGYNIFERIAKEGRKFGMLLGISSQRPSELSKTVVSQCSNFIIHRVQNPDDLQYLSKMVPYVNNNMIDRLTYIQTGNALVFGSAINLPTLTKFDQANPATDSGNAKISEKWYIE